MLEKLEEIDKKLDSLVNSRLPRAFESASAGMREAAAGGPVRALVAAPPAEVRAWLKDIGFEQYAPPLAPMGGAWLLLQTPESLMRMGIIPQHADLLMTDIIRAALREPCLPRPPPPPKTDADAQDAR